MKETLSLITMLLLLCPLVFADGMIHIYDQDMWNLQLENQQLAAINYQDGFENMLISIDINDDVHGEKAVWIFPVPANPDKVVIDVLKGFPRFYGKDIDSSYKDAVRGVGMVMAGYSTFPLIFPLAFAYFGVLSPGAMLASRGAEDVVIHETITKMGLTTELITTQSSEALNQYLQNKGLNLPEKSVAMLNDYVGKNYSFVVSYISNLAQFKQESQINMNNDYNYYGGRNYNSGIPIGVFVKFPTDKIYFPLKPTSVYGSQEIPILLYVIGHVTPVLYPEIKPQSEVTYYKGYNYYPETDMSTFFNGQSELNNLMYTKIKITAPSKYFVDDLWIKNSAPASVKIKGFFATYYWLWGIILFILLSMAASVLSGMVSFRKEPLPKKKLLLHGLWNCLTIIGLIIATIAMKTKEIDPKILQELKAKGLDVTVRDVKKILYVFLFYVFFIVLVVALTLILVVIA